MIKPDAIPAKFKEDLAIGKQGENTVLEFLSNNKESKFYIIQKNTGTNVKAVDLKVLYDGKWELFELKTENYCGTKNLYLEVLSDEDKETPGGVFRAAIEDAKFISHYFLGKKILYIYDVQKYLEIACKLLLEHHPTGHDLDKIKNADFISRGVSMPLTYFKDALIETHTILE